MLSKFISDHKTAIKYALIGKIAFSLGIGAGYLAFGNRSECESLRQQNSQLEQNYNKLKWEKFDLYFEKQRQATIVRYPCCIQAIRGIGKNYINRFIG